MIWFFFILLLVLSLEKMIVMWKHCYYAVRHGSAIAREFGYLVVKWRNIHFDNTELVSFLNKYRSLFRFEGWEWTGISLKFVKPFFWVPSLALGWIVLIVVEDRSNRSLLLACIVLLLTIIWTYAAQMFIMRIHLGAVEFFYRIQSIKRTTGGADRWLAPKHDIVRGYILVVIGLIVITVVGYSAAYYGISRFDELSFKDSALSDSGQHPISAVTALYFSITTFSTVGFGDVIAVSDLARLVVVTEILLSLGLIVLVLMVFSITLDMEG